MTDEHALLDRAKAYDPDALAALYDRYAPKLYAYIYRRVSDAALAEDLTSELFLRVLRAIQNKRTWRDSFVAWLYRIAHNLVVDVYRGQPPPPISLEDAPALAAGDDPVRETQEAMDRAKDREKLRAAIRHLTPDQQQVLALRYGEGLTARETAHVVRKTTGAVEAIQRRALAAIKRLLVSQEKPDRQPSKNTSGARDLPAPRYSKSNKP